MRVATLAPCLLVLCACDPVWIVNTVVRSPTGAPLAGAHVALKCPEGDEAKHHGVADADTDADGRARLGGGSMLPVGCRFVVDKSGYARTEVAYEELCPDPEECDRAQALDVTLAPSGP